MAGVMTPNPDTRTTFSAKNNPPSEHEVALHNAEARADAFDAKLIEAERRVQELELQLDESLLQANKESWRLLAEKTRERAESAEARVQELEREVRDLEGALKAGKEEHELLQFSKPSDEEVERVEKLLTPFLKGTADLGDGDGSFIVHPNAVAHAALTARKR
jgi:hypothetical protein